MNQDLDRLFAQIQSLEDDIERRLNSHRDQLRFSLQKGRAVFDDTVAQAHRRLRVGVFTYLLHTPLLYLLVAPVIYAMVIPFAILDLSLTVYQWICFSAWRISRVQRRQYVVIDRHRLGYLNAIEKLNCVYCGYGNGVIA